ncbi:MAG: NYN domain-containing protein [Christensenellaceae bacterium]|jgi:hypothetical protein
MQSDKRIAVLIDADNVSKKYLTYIFDEISNQGTPTYKRIYGDWTKPQLSSWKANLLEYSITPIQQYNYTTGKNSTDSALIIDAMDILYSGNIDGFCIVSSDSDFTRLASRLREAGMFVMGMGERKTPAPFIASCEVFKYLEVLEEISAETEEGETKKKVTARKKSADVAKLATVKKAIVKIVSESSDEDGWVFLGTVANIMNRRYPDFDTRNYGHYKLKPFVASLGCFEIEDRPTKNPRAPQTYIKIKE